MHIPANKTIDHRSLEVQMKRFKNPFESTNLPLNELLNKPLCADKVPISKSNSFLKLHHRLLVADRLLKNMKNKLK